MCWTYCPRSAVSTVARLNFDELLYGTTPGFLRTMARAYQQKGVRPELEVFELGHIELAKQLIAEGLIDQPALFQLCLGIKYGAPATSEAMKAMRDALPPGSRWSAFGLGRMQMPMAALRCCSAAMCAWAWKTISIWTRESRRPTLNWSSEPAASSSCWECAC